jgi:hypothetical protein
MEGLAQLIAVIAFFYFIVRCADPPPTATWRRPFRVFPDDAVRVAAFSIYVDRQARDRLPQRPPGETMTAATTVPPTVREPRLLGQPVVVIGGSSGIGLETA